eukprot:3251295-Pleurochrysis_carterae.AAC.2
MDGELHYRVKWKRWPEEDCTWEPKEKLEGYAALEAYLAQNRAIGKRRASSHGAKYGGDGDSSS